MANVRKKADNEDFLTTTKCTTKTKTMMKMKTKRKLHDNVKQRRRRRRQQSWKNNFHALVFTTIGIISTFVFIWVISESSSLLSLSSASSSSSLSWLSVADKNGTMIHHLTQKVAGEKGGTVVSKNFNTKDKADSENKMSSCSMKCEKQQQQQQQQQTGTGTGDINDNNPLLLLDRNELLVHALQGKIQLVQKLRVDYGDDYFDAIFLKQKSDPDEIGKEDEDVNVTNPDPNQYRPIYPMSKNGPSFERLKRKLMIKILRMQSTVVNKIKHQELEEKKCDCSSISTSTNDSNTTIILPTFEKYVWATGGHSAAAGHGNLYNESYTAYLERDVQPLFAGVGLEFEGRNYAMGAQVSAPEVSMCYKEIYGTDVDMLSWDFGLTDGRDFSKSLHYLYRGGMSPGRPALMLLHGNIYHEKHLRVLEEIGMSTFTSKRKSIERMKNGFPDSGLDSNYTGSTALLPEYVRNYKCGAQIEKGAPYCGKEKYTSYRCPKRWHQTGWHPGFKDHASIGHGVALFVMETLLSTLRDLKNHPIKDIDTLLLQLTEEEDLLYSNITTMNDNTSVELPGAVNAKFLQPDELQVMTGQSSSSLFYKGPSMCHISKLPSQLRYLGYLTNDTDTTTSKVVGKPAPYGKEEYDVGIHDKVADDTSLFNANGTMPLVYQTYKIREECDGDQTVIVKPDYPDYFAAREEYGWVELIFPNVAEQQAYQYQPTNYQGLILLNFSRCDYGKCTDDLRLNEYNKKKWTMTINDEPVLSLAQLGITAVAVGRGGGGGNNGTSMTSPYFTPNVNGQYVIKIKVNQRGVVRITSFILY